MNGYRIEFVTGKVLGQQKHVETHVYSEGGGGYVGPNGGRVKAPVVKSHNTTRHDIFLGLENGQEISVSFPFSDIILRDGHVITLVSAFRNVASSGFYVRLLNHNTEVIYNVTTNEALNFLVNAEPNAKPLKSGCLLALAIFITAWILQSNFSAFEGTLGSFTLIAVVIMVLGYTKYSGAQKLLVNKAKNELDVDINGALAQLANGGKLPDASN